MHHWLYHNLFDVPISDLSVLSIRAHSVIHSWISSGEIKCDDPNRLEVARVLYQSRLKQPNYQHRSFVRLKKWIKAKRKSLSKELFSKNKSKRKKLRNLERRIERPPTTKRWSWSNISEEQRHKIAIDRNSSIVIK